MHAIIRSGGKQFRVGKGDVIRVPLVTAEPGSDIEITDVLLVSDEDKQQVGTPLVPKARVRGKVLRHGKTAKTLVYTYKRRKGFEKRRGHRQDYSEVRIDEIIV
jgi:large subunit ribosomal protein L21